MCRAFRALWWLQSAILGIVAGDKRDLDKLIHGMASQGMVCWEGICKKRDVAQLDRLVRKAGSVVGTDLDSLVTVAESP
ncbi:uncharacterized protein LOC123984521 isoform X1 [Tachysurus ichikawai]